jgi:hypothetical protein
MYTPEYDRDQEGRGELRGEDMKRTAVTKEKCVDSSARSAR